MGSRAASVRYELAPRAALPSSNRPETELVEFGINENGTVKLSATADEHFQRNTSRTSAIPLVDAILGDDLPVLGVLDGETAGQEGSGPQSGGRRRCESVRR
jgi:hypothetical protein